MYRGDAVSGSVASLRAEVFSERNSVPKLARKAAVLIVLALSVLVSATLASPAAAAPDPFDLEVRLAGWGYFQNYSVQSADGKIKCGSRFGTSGQCIGAYDPQTQVTLTASVQDPQKQKFELWGGACAAFGESLTCTVTMDEAKHVWASFAEVDDDFRAVFVTKTGNGAGNVRSELARIDCGPNCLGALPDDSPVTFTAKPDNGSRFVRWEGVCSGTEPTCVLSAGQPHSVVRAVFELKPNLLFINKTGDGHGNVTSAPNGISCGIECVYEFGWGTEVTLSAKAAAGSRFTGWSGACGTAIGRSCRVTVSTLRWVQANFVPLVLPSPPAAKFGALAVNPKVRAVKPGKRVVFKVKVRNTGGTSAKGVKVCVKAAKRLVRVKRCLTVGSLAPGRVANLKFKVRTTRNLKRGRKATLVFAASASGLAKKQAGATLKVK